LFLQGLNSVFISVFIFAQDVSSSKGFNQMLAVFWNPSHVEDKFTLNLSLGSKRLVSLDSERCQYDVTLFITSVSLDKEAAFLQNTIKGDFFALPVIGFVVVEFLKKIRSSLFVAYSLNKLSLSLIVLIGNEILEIPVDTCNNTGQSQGKQHF
jgi:hypothetical protein